jgi:Holin of 3TMs, for gene-transfer release
MAADPLTAVLDVGGKLLDKFFPDADAEMKSNLQQFMAVFTAQAQIVQSEAQSQNWLASSWRPITMLTFVVLIVARWFGWAAPNLSEAEYLKLWDIVQLGLGGYVIGRSVEKIIPSVAGAMKK